MGKTLSCCSRFSTARHHGAYQKAEMSYLEHLNLSAPMEVSSTQESDITFQRQRTRSFEHSLQSSQGGHDKYNIVNEGTKGNPKLECIIIPSFGKDPPSNVAPKKASSDYLKGVGDDFKIIQDLIGKDKQKELVRVQLMCHFERVKLAEFMKMIEERMKDLKLRNVNNGQEGLLIWYTGHGEKGTGNWVLEDGCLKFEDVYNLYMKYFKGRYLYIVSDCCYSGSWVEECAKLLDRDGIKCGHDAKHQQILIKVFAACLPKEQAFDKFYTECKGVKLHSKGDVRTIVFAQHRKLKHKSGDGSQTTLGVDFTQTSTCIPDEGGKCHVPTWTKLVQLLSKEEGSNNYLL